MNRVGKSMGAFAATIICFVLVCGSTLPLALAADTTPPVTNASLVGTYNSTSGWYYGDSGPTVSLSATDDNSGVAHTYYRLDSNAEVTYTSSFTIADGSHTLAFRSVDNAGNTETLSASHNYLTLNVDIIKPTLNITINGKWNATAGCYSGNTSVNLTASDKGSGVSSIQYSFDNSNWKDYAGNITIPDGSNTLYYRSYDKAGNVNASSMAFNVFNPEILTSPAHDTWYDHYIYGIMFVKPASNDTRYIQYSYSSDHKVWYTYDMDNPAPFDLFKEGNYSIWYRAVSRSGNTSDIRFMWFGIDITPPTIGISYDGDMSRSKGWFNGDVTVHINANDNGSISRTEYSWDNSNWNTYKDPFKVTWGKSRTIFYRTFDMYDRTASGSTFIYFRPGSVDQGPMSDTVYINGSTSGGNPTATASPTENPTPVPTQQPTPTPTIEPSATPVPDTSSGSGNPLAIAVLVGVLAFLGIAAAAVYLFMSKKK
ncbi:hypothetical protein MCP_0331 [Methanocella paludicola SANAE]|uniref:Uncharacterized protein n=1 Tax=Methanocella paludicola (strain DSM 17711 / JCM 13418 / NBRC 101707 / SANAE) TaxID=304371 RepID=D1YVD1_METPS|nr:hypothetical protein [Methanocella paludicola]BAI60403.1 hypothetical protein MCP_0331 [Methanocella paludicola SANAE]